MATARFRARGPGVRVEKHPVVVLERVRLCAGRSHVFVGEYSSTVDDNMLKGADIRCVPVSGDGGSPGEQSRRRSVFSTRNHGPQVSEPRALEVRWVFTPSRDESGLFDCELRGWGQTSGGLGWVTPVDGGNTRLSVSGVERGASEWRQGQDVYLCWDAPQDDPGCARSGVALRQAPGERFTAAAGARSIDVYAGVEASICSAGYQACTGGTAGLGDFVIRTRLVATQLLNTEGSTLCPSAEPQVRDRTTPIAGDGDLNHTKVHLDMAEPVPVVDDPSCSRTFAVRVLVNFVRTTPTPGLPNHGGLVEGRIPDGDASDPEALNRAYTSAIVLNNY